jgi:RNA polymerase sigma factor (sigma-70 family)
MDYALLRSTARRLLKGGWSHEIDDLCQEGAIAVWQKLHLVPADPDHATAFKRQVARWAMVDYMRANSWQPARRNRKEGDASILPLDTDDMVRLEDVANTPDNAAERVTLRDAERRLGKVLKRSDGRAAEVVRGTLAGETGESLAARLNVSPSLVSKIITRVVDGLEQHPA